MTTMAKIMIVDDSLMVRQQVKHALALTNFAVVEAEDGIDALAKLEKESDISVIICDVNMPRMDGFEFLEKLRKTPAFADLPFVMLTTEAHSELIHRARALKAKGWVLKPFKPDLLLGAIRKLAAVAPTS
jgi:two-component system chemotaxis response regulator CheY